MIGYWHDTVVCLSVCLWRNDSLHPTAKCLNKWIGSVPVGTRPYNFQPPLVTPCSHSPHLLNHRRWCHLANAVKYTLIGPAKSLLTYWDQATFQSIYIGSGSRNRWSVVSPRPPLFSLYLSYIPPGQFSLSPSPLILWGPLFLPLKSSESRRSRPPSTFWFIWAGLKIKHFGA